MTCPLCETDGGLVVFKNEQFRIVQAVEAGFPAFYRLVWNAHVAEFSDLSIDERSICMNAVVSVEQILREQLRPTKINLAALGNMHPHLHWHIVARFDWDTHFPAPVWSPAQRAENSEKLAQTREKCVTINRLITQSLA